jgi:hypothetical protein
MTAGTLSSSSNVTVNGSIVGVAGTFSLSGSAILEQRVAAAETFGTTSGSTNWSILNLKFSNSAGVSSTITTNSGGSGTVTVTSVMTVGLATDTAKTILSAGNRTWTLSGTGGDPLVIDVATNASSITGSTSTFSYTGANAGGNTTVEKNSSGTYYNLIVNAIDTFVLEGAIDVDNTLTIQHASAILDTTVTSYGITIGGSYANSGTFTANSGTVTFDAGAGSKTLSGTMTGTSAFYDITFNNAAGGWSFGSDSATASNNFTITTGTVTGSTGTLSVGNNYSNSGTFTHNSGTMKFTATDSGNTLSGTLNGSSLLYNLTFDGVSGSWTPGSTTAVSSTLTITNGTLIAPASLTIGLSYSNSGTFTAGSGTVTLNGSAAQTLSGTMTGSSAFYNLVFNQSIVLAEPDCERTGFFATVDFNAAATISNLYQIIANVAVEYESGATYTVNNMDWQASSIFRNSAITGTWLLNVTATGNAQTKVSYVNVSRSDASGGATIIASDGTNTNCGNNTNWQFDEALTLSFDSTSKTFGTINGGDTPADQTTTLTATSNSSTGYTIYGWTTTKLRMTRAGVDYDVDDWTGTNASPTTWSGGSYGFGYNTDDTSLTGGTASRFSGSKYAAWVHAGYGDPVADRTAAATGATNTISYRFYPDPAQTAGTYSTTIIYVITANFP